jgi:hypothetical protein
LISGEDCKPFDLVSTCTAAVRAVVANQRTIPKQEEVGLRIEKGVARVASKTVGMPSIIGFRMLADRYGRSNGGLTNLVGFAFLQYLLAGQL